MRMEPAPGVGKLEADAHVCSRRPGPAAVGQEAHWAGRVTGQHGPEAGVAREGLSQLWREVRRPGDSPPSFQHLPMDRPLHAGQAHIKEHRVPGLGQASALQQAHMPVHTGTHAHACAHTAKQMGTHCLNGSGKPSLTACKESSIPLPWCQRRAICFQRRPIQNGGSFTVTETWSAAGAWPMRPTGPPRTAPPGWPRTCPTMRPHRHRAPGREGCWGSRLVPSPGALRLRSCGVNALTSSAPVSPFSAPAVCVLGSQGLCHVLKPPHCGGLAWTPLGSKGPSAGVGVPLRLPPEPCPSPQTCPGSPVEVLSGSRDRLPFPGSTKLLATCTWRLGGGNGGLGPFLAAF